MHGVQWIALLILKSRKQITLASSTNKGYVIKYTYADLKQYIFANYVQKELKLKGVWENWLQWEASSTVFHKDVSSF